MRDRELIYRDILARCREREQGAWFHSDRAAAKAARAHLAVIPPLLKCEDERRHRHYMEIDRVRFLRSCRKQQAADLEPLWAELAERLGSPTVIEEAKEARIEGPITLDYERKGRGE